MSLSAQSFDLYALAGPVVSQIDGDRIGGYDKFGIVAGVGLSRPYSKHWSGVMELEYISKGKGSYTESTGATNKTALHYIELPILAHYHLDDKFSLESGLSFAALMSYQFYEDGQESSHNPWDPNSFDFEWLFGASYKLNEDLAINLRFSTSITPMGLTSDIEVVHRPNIFKHPYGMYNRSVAIAFQYWFSN